MKILGIFFTCDVEQKTKLNFYHVPYTRVQVDFFGRENELKKSTSTYIRENMRHTY